MFLTVDFGINNSGLGTVGYTLIDNVGADAQARTIVDVVDAGNGSYGVEIDISTVPAAVFVKWDTGGGSPIYAHESLVTDEIFRYVMENGETYAEQIRLMRAEAAGKVAVTGGTNVKFRDAADAKDRIDATVDADGQRTSVTTDGT